MEKFTVKLTEEQIKKITKSFRTCESAIDIVQKIVMKVAEEVEEEKEKLWDQVYKLGGVSPSDYKATVEYITNEVVFTPLTERR